MTRTQSLFAFFGVGIVAAIAGILLARTVIDRSTNAPTLSQGTLLQPARAVQPFALIDQEGAPFDNSRLRDHWTFMFFGFTNCGDVCPTTLTLLASVAKKLDDLPIDKRPQVVFVSVDSRRDTPAALKEYLKHFDPRFVGVTGAQSDLDTFTASLGVPSAIRELEQGYAVDHSSSILAFNPRGEFQAIFSPPHAIEGLSGDFRALTRAAP